LISAKDQQYGETQFAVAERLGARRRAYTDLEADLAGAAARNRRQSIFSFRIRTMGQPGDPRTVGVTLRITLRSRS
jgi:hypothetical protein